MITSKEVWIAVYVAVIARGYGNDSAKYQADIATEHYKEFLNKAPDVSKKR